LRPSISAGNGDGKDRLNREIDTRVRHHETNYSVGMGVQLFAPLQVGVTAKRSIASFPDSAEFRGERLDVPLNSTTDTIEVGTNFALTPLTTVSMAVDTDNIRFALSPDRNAHSLRIAPRVTFSPLAFLQGTATVGYRRFVSDSKKLEPYHGLMATVGLGTTIAERYRVDASFSRDLSYSYDSTAPYYIETGTQLTWTFTVFGPVDLRLQGGRSRLNYRAATLNSSDDDDIVHNYGFTVSYRLKETLKFGVTGEWRDRRSERSADRTYDTHRVFGNFTWGKS
jgi:hypothetical protein